MGLKKEEIYYHHCKTKVQFLKASKSWTECENNPILKHFYENPGEENPRTTMRVGIHKLYACNHGVGLKQKG